MKISDRILNQSEIEDQLLILGLLKELLFYRIPIKMYEFVPELKTSPNFLENASDWTLTIVSIAEGHPRRTEDEKSFLVRIPQTQNPRIFEGKKTIVLTPPSHVVVLECVFEPAENNCVRAFIPKKGTLINRRTNKDRIRIQESIHPQKVLASSHSIHTECSIEISNISEVGLGGVITVPKSFPVSSETVCHGQVQFGAEALTIDHQIKRFTLIFEDEEFQTLEVGLERVAPLSQLSWKDLERRVASRTVVQKGLRLTHALERVGTLDGYLIDHSITGFAWYPENYSVVALFIPGLVVQVTEFELKAQVVGVDDGRIRFHIVDGNTSSFLLWLKHIERSPIPEGHISDAIISLFCDSGAFASGYLKKISSDHSQLLESLDNAKKNSSWLHRWLEPGINGSSAISHVSAFRISDNVWHIGEIATSNAVKGSSQGIVGRAISCLAHSMMNEKSPVAMLIMWAKGHPYWNAFEAYLGENPNLTIASIDFLYVRSQATFSKSIDLEVSEISGEEIEKTRSAVIDTSAEVLPLLEYLDLNPFSYGSPRLRSAIEGSDEHFHRAYFEIKNGEKLIAVAITTKFPLGSALQRTSDASYIIVLDSSFEYQEIISNLEFHCRPLGIDPVGSLLYGVKTSDSDKILSLKLLNAKAGLWFSGP